MYTYQPLHINPTKTYKFIRQHSSKTRTIQHSHKKREVQHSSTENYTYQPVHINPKKKNPSNSPHLIMGACVVGMSPAGHPGFRVWSAMPSNRNRQATPFAQSWHADCPSLEGFVRNNKMCQYLR